MSKQYQTIGLGGTFDHFHAGHRHFLQSAFALAEKLFIGITSDHMIQSKPLPHILEPLTVRQQSVIDFCQQNNIPYEITVLEDIYGPTTTAQTKVEALCVTSETRPGADKINRQRHQAGLTLLPIHETDFVLTEDGEPLHAFLIRGGKVNRDGKVYSQVLRGDLVLTDQQRHYFSQPQGELVRAYQPTPSPTCVVGDWSLENFLRQNWQYTVGVFDRKKQRQPYSSEAINQLHPTTKVISPAGTISLQLSKALQAALTESHWHVEVEGEEDLAAVALILLSPLSTHIYYGQPNVGMVCIKVTEELKDQVYRLLHPNLSQN